MLSLLKSLASRLAVESLPRALRLIRVVIGFTLLAIGIALTVLPGPAFVVIPVALAVLAGEFVWARNLLKRFNAGLRNGLYPYGWLARFRESIRFALKGKRGN